MADALPPLRNEIEVGVPPAEAFRIWTDEIGRWWPLATHSVGQAVASTCRVEGRAGGRVYETTRAGAKHLWVQVTDGTRRTVSLHLAFRPEAGDQIMVSVSFSPLGPHRTRLEQTALAQPGRGNEPDHPVRV